MTEKTGIEKARETAARIKGTINTEESKAITHYGVSPEALAFMKRKAREDRGVEVNEGGSLPMLTLIQNDEFSGEIAHKADPIPGAYYYKPKQIQIENPVVNIVYIRECKLDTQFQGVVTKNKSHYLIAGILDETKDPFVMYIKGLSYGEVAIEETSLMTQTREWRKHPENPIPLYLFRIQLGSSKKESDWGKKRVTTYLMLKDENGLPQIVTDMDMMEVLDASVDSSKRIIDGIIERNHSGQITKDVTYADADAALIGSEPEGEVGGHSDFPF